MMFGLSQIQIFGAALVAAFLLSGVAYLKGRADGKALERKASLEAVLRQIEERKKTDESIGDMGPDDLCHALGGRMSDAGECE